MSSAGTFSVLVFAPVILVSVSYELSPPYHDQLTLSVTSPCAADAVAVMVSPMFTLPDLSSVTDDTLMEPVLAMGRLTLRVYVLEPILDDTTHWMYLPSSDAPIASSSPVASAMSAKGPPFASATCHW